MTHHPPWILGWMDATGNLGSVAALPTHCRYWPRSSRSNCLALEQARVAMPGRRDPVLTLEECRALPCLPPFASSETLFPPLEAFDATNQHDGAAQTPRGFRPNHLPCSVATASGLDTLRGAHSVSRPWIPARASASLPCVHPSIHCSCSLAVCLSQGSLQPASRILLERNFMEKGKPHESATGYLTVPT